MLFFERALNCAVTVTVSDEVPATGTGTLIIQLEDVNDNAPIIEERAIRVSLSQILFQTNTHVQHFVNINVILLLPGVQ